MHSNQLQEKYISQPTMQVSQGKKVSFSNELGALFIYNWHTYAMNPSMSSGLKQHSLCLYGRGNTDFSSLTSSLLGACLLSENKRKKRKCIAE